MYSDNIFLTDYYKKHKIGGNKMSVKNQTAISYTRIMVKSSKLFYTYIVFFITIFMVITTSVKVEVRTKYESEIYGNEICTRSEKEIRCLNDQIYVYKDKNQKVFSLELKSANYRDGMMCFGVKNNSENISGRVIMEVITQKRSLLQTIIMSTGE